MAAATNGTSSRFKVRAHRARLRAQGLRPIQIWVPDVRAPGFKAEAHRQSEAVAKSAQAIEDQAFIDAVSDRRLSKDLEWGGAISGDIWTVSGGKDYAGKPRPVVIVQASDR